MHLIGYPVNVRQDPRHDRQTGLLEFISPLILHQMLLVDIPFLVQPPALVFQRNQIQSVLQCPAEIRQKQTDQCLLFLTELLGKYQQELADRLILSERNQIKIQHDLVFSGSFRHISGRLFFKHFLILVFFLLIQQNGNLIHRKDAGQSLFQYLPEHLRHFSDSLCLHRNTTGNPVTKIQYLTQFRQVSRIPFTPPAVQENKTDNEEQQTGNHQGQKYIQLLRFTFQNGIPALQFLVLTRIIQYVQINVPVIVRFRFAVHGRIRPA